MKNILIYFILSSQFCQAQFYGDYDPRKFTHTSLNSNGSSTFSGGVTLLTINGPNNSTGKPGEEDETINITTNSTLNFSVSLTDADAAGYDDFGYLINNVRTSLAAGNHSIDVTAGQTFSFYVSSKDNDNGALVANISMDFKDKYAPSNFTHTSTNSNGAATFGGAPTLLTIDGTNNNNGNNGGEYETVTVGTSGMISFNAVFTAGNTTADNAFGYIINGTLFPLTPGDYKINVTAGQSFSFYVTSINNMAIPLNVAVSNFSFMYPLAVKLINFSGTNNSVQLNELNWRTSGETNSGSFELQRSTDAKLFVKLGAVLAQVNSETSTNYSYADSYNFLPGIKYFYRLKIIDQDMKFTYSPVVALNSKDEPAISIFPNPFIDKVLININAAVSEQAKIELLDINGKEILAETKNLAAGLNNISMNTTQNLRKGIYFLNLITLSNKTIIKLIKM